MSDFHTEIITIALKYIKEQQSTSERLMIARASMIAGISVLHVISEIAADTDDAKHVNAAISLLKREVCALIDEALNKAGGALRWAE